MQNVNVLALQTTKIQIKIENFEGPLDLLCYLVDKNKMDIYDIKLDEITDQYIEYIHQMEKEKLGISSEFLVMASALLLMKSKGLLPNSDTSGEDELTEEELIRRIVEYKKYKEIIQNLREMYKTYSNRIFKNVPENIPLPKQTLDKNYEKDIIVKLYSEAMERYQTKVNINAQNIERIAIRDTYTVGSKVKEMFRELIRKPKFVFNKMYTLSKHNKIEVITAFTGLLELSRRSKVLTEQDELFGDITVERKKKNPK
ncbi:MAG: segregation/condensation protein A [Clostridia bacterium]|nr:segregation/condensation protein A [Clostridia bacterium]